jgi:thiosulfate/3-mercaptopyruvate sulfurtransferase
MSSLITAADLLQNLNQATLLIVDTRFSLADSEYGQQAYAQTHIPGAVYLDLNRDLSALPAVHGGRHPWPDAENLVERLKAVGLCNHSQVVVYDDASNLYAGRLWGLLRWLGHEHVQVLDGGWQAWLATGFAVSSEQPVPTPGVFVPQLQPHFLVDQTELHTRSSAAVLLDARSADRYRGENETRDPRAGHIPGALSRPFADNLEGLFYKSPAQLRSEFLALGLKPEQEIIVYCGSGVSANHTLIALAEAGFSGGRLYGGSWSDWVSYPENPVAIGPQA